MVRSSRVLRRFAGPVTRSAISTATLKEVVSVIPHRILERCAHWKNACGLLPN